MIMDMAKTNGKSIKKRGYTKGDFRRLYSITILFYVMYRDVRYNMLFVSENPREHIPANNYLTYAPMVIEPDGGISCPVLML